MNTLTTTQRIADEAAAQLDPASTPEEIARFVKWQYNCLLANAGKSHKVEDSAPRQDLVDAACAAIGAATFPTFAVGLPSGAGE